MLFRHEDKMGLLFYLIILTGMFIFFELGVFVLGSELYLGDYQFIAKHLGIPWKVVQGILFFIFVQFLLHICLLLWIWVITRCVGLVFSLKEKSVEFLGIGIWLVAIITLLLANQYFFVNSKFAALTSTIIPKAFIPYCFWFFIVSVCVLQCIALYGVLKKSRFLFTILISIFFTTTFCFLQKPVILDYATVEKPNIIFIGIDALRPDFLGFFGNSQNTTPHLDDFFENATVFSESLSPIARTFPAWMSILTGEYPKINAIRTDLMDKKDFNNEITLSSILQKNGYETIFATDDSRFSNINKHLGFDKIVAPSIGLNNFLIGTMNDFPLSNLLVNTYVGSFLLPYSHANRAAFTTYNPNTFIQDINRILEKPRSSPLFLAVHFCLPHFPYVWADTLWKKNTFLHYYSAVQRVDQQFYDFLNMLEKNQMLKHSIVVILSDHGEALRLPGDRITEQDLFLSHEKNNHNPPHFYPGDQLEKINQSSGHGTDVLSMSQYHTVLAFRYFGLKGQRENVVPGRVSLLDIKPTILQVLGIKHKQNTANGRSLIDYIAGNRASVTSNEHFFIESDFSPDSVRTAHPETRKVIFEGLEYFQINPQTTHVSVKPSMLRNIISSKQYADFYGHWVLALYPQNDQWMMPILVNLETGEWTNDLRTPFAKTAPTSLMLDALRSFFREDLKEIMHYSS